MNLAPLEPVAWYSIPTVLLSDTSVYVEGVVVPHRVKIPFTSY